MSSCLRGIPTHEESVNLSRDPSSLRTTIVMRSVAVIGEGTVASLEPEHIEHVVPAGWLGVDPGGRPERTRRENRARGGAVTDLEAFGGAEEVGGVLADDVAAAHRGHADLTARAGADVAIAGMALDAVVVRAVAGRNRPGDHQRRPRRSIALGAVVGLDDL